MNGGCTKCRSLTPETGVCILWYVCLVLYYKNYLSLETVCGFGKVLGGATVYFFKNPEKDLP